MRVEIDKGIVVDAENALHCTIETIRKNKMKCFVKYFSFIKLKLMKCKCTANSDDEFSDI